MTGAVSAAVAAALRSGGLRSAVCSASNSAAGIGRNQLPRWYSFTRSVNLAEASTAAAEADEDPAKPNGLTVADKRRAARMYNDVRAQYKREVSALRKKYAAEYKRKKDADDAARERERARLTRRRLERQRLKNTRSALNARRESEKREARMAEKASETEERLRERDLREGRMMKARALLLEELEAEAPHWLTTAEEVEAALGNDAASQILWARRGGQIGAPAAGTDDSPFWRYECHHWDMSKTYKTAREVLLEDLEEEIYEETNVDYGHWNADRIALAEFREEKAKLRAMVREEGRKRLLERQRSMMSDQRARETARDERERGVPLPTAMPVPSLKVLADVEAQEAEGVKALEEDPGMFFRFADDDDDDEYSAQGSGDTAATDAAGSAASSSDAADSAKLLTQQQRGAPLGLRDRLRDPNGGTPYPLVLGRMPRKDDRTDAQKKRDEREARMWEAARKAEEEAKRRELGGVAGSEGAAGGSDAAADAGPDIDDVSVAPGEEVDYDTVGNEQEEFDVDWEEGLDPHNPDEAAALQIPPQYRYTEEDIDWVLGELEAKTKTLTEFYEMERMEEGGRKRAVGADDGGLAAASSSGDSWKDGATVTEGYDSKSQKKFVQYDLPDYEPEGVSDDELIRQIDAAQKIVEEGGDLPEDPASLTSTAAAAADDGGAGKEGEEETAAKAAELEARKKKAAGWAPPPSGAAASLFADDPELDVLAKRLGVDDILAELTQDDTDFNKEDPLSLTSLAKSGGDGVKSALADLTPVELALLDGIRDDPSLSSLGSEGLDPNDASDTLEEDRVLEALRTALPDGTADATLEKLVRLEMELERDEGVRRAVLGEGRGGGGAAATEAVAAEEGEEEGGDRAEEAGAGEDDSDSNDGEKKKP